MANTVVIAAALPQNTSRDDSAPGRSSCGLSGLMSAVLSPSWMTLRTRTAIGVVRTVDFSPAGPAYGNATAGITWSPSVNVVTQYRNVYRLPPPAGAPTSGGALSTTSKSPRVLSTTGAPSV